jgi:hypothetical protein
VACSRLPYGVGNGKNKPDFYELGLSYVNRVPRVWTANVGGKRVSLSTKELFNVNLFREKCAEYGAEFPNRMKATDWDLIVRRAIENATMVEPTDIMKTNANEVGIIQRFFGMHIPNSVRALGQEYLNGKGKPDDLVRIRDKEHRIYFKFEGFENFCRRAQFMSKQELQGFREYISEIGEWHDRTCSLGRWYRSTYSLDMGLFNEETIKRWLAGGEIESGEDDV